MSSTFWPGTNIRRSRGNGFDLSGRKHSIFYVPKRSTTKPAQAGAAAISAPIAEAKQKARVRD